MACTGSSFYDVSSKGETKQNQQRNETKRKETKGQGMLLACSSAGAGLGLGLLWWGSAQLELRVGGRAVLFVSGACPSLLPHVVV